MDGFDLLAPVAGCPFPSILGSNSNDSNDDPSAGWVTLAAPGFRVARRSLRVFDPDDLSQASFRLRQPWPPRLAAAAEAAEGVLLIVLCAAATAVRTAPAGRAGRWAAALPRTGAIWAWTAAAAVTEVAHGAGLLLGGHTREALLPLAAWVPLRIAAGVAALLAPAHSAAAALAAGAAGVAARAAGDCLALRDCAGLSADPPCVPAALAAAGAALLLLQRRARSRIRAAYLADCALSDAAWEAARPDPAGLARLRDVVAAAAAACNGKEQARQWDQSTGAPVESLDRLLAQAIGVSPFLRARVSKWAGVQVGTEPSESGQGLQGEGQARQGTGGGWAKSLKDPRRAVEKAVRCYGRDASRLLDLCRVRLAFDGPGQVVDFLERMASDPSARVVRFKDGMCGGPGRAALEGFRCVVVNLRLETSETLVLGVNCHICEVQLILRFQAELIAREAWEAMHFRYLNHRALRQLAYTNLVSFPFLNFAKFSSWHIASYYQQTGTIVRLQVATGDGQEISVCPSKEPGQAEMSGTSDSESRGTPSIAGLPNSIHNELLSSPGDTSDESRRSALAGIEAEQLPAFTRVMSVNGTSSIPTAGQLSTLDAMCNVYLRAVHQNGGAFDKQVASISDAMLQSSSGSVLFSSTPVAAAMSKRTFQVFGFTSAVMYACIRLPLSIQAMRSAGLYTPLPSLVCLQATGLRNVSLSPEKAMVGGFGLTLNGCPVAGGQYLPRSANVNCSGADYSLAKAAVLASATACVSFSTPQEGNGYYFDTVSVQKGIENDPVQWTIKASADNGLEWWSIGASAWFIQYSGKILYFPGLSFGTPTERDVRVMFSAQPPWEWVFIWINSQMVQGIGFFATALAGTASKLSLARSLLIGTLALVAVGMAVAAIGYHIEGLTRDACFAWLAALPSGLLALGVVIFEVHILKVLVSVAAVYVLVIVLHSAVLYPDNSVLLKMLATGPGVLLISLAAMGAIMRSLAVRAADRLISEDKAAYDTIWANLIAEHSTYQSLECLKLAVLELGQVAEKISLPKQIKLKGARQYNSKHVHASKHDRQQRGMFFGSDDAASPGTLNWSSPVLSLDQLFVQAECLAPFLVVKVQEWAQSSCGYFPLHQQSLDGSAAVVRWTAVGYDASIVRWGRIKSVSRAVEKATRSYGKDVSRLLDLCRQSILFQTVDDLIVCLQIIRNDPDAYLVQVKNRMDRSFDSAQTAGYRDVSINLRLVNSRTAELGVDTHVCELQLILLPIFRLKSGVGHARYVSFRNLRAE